ncbi:LRR containing protein [Entamoeba marina]
MSLLEKIYLANVVLYLDTLDDAENFTIINKKCKDATEILRINPGYHVKKQNGMTKGYDHYKFMEYISFLKELTLFPNLETVRIKQEYIPYLPEFTQNVRIHYFDTSLACPDLWKDIIVELKLYCNGNALDLSQFPFLRKVSFISINHITSMKQFFTQKDKHFNNVTIKIEQQGLFDEEFLNNLEQYDFDRVVLKFIHCNNKLQIASSIPNIFTNATLCTDQWYNTIDDRVVVLRTFNYSFKADKTHFFDEKFCKQQYPDCVYLQGAEYLNLTEFTSIERMYCEGCQNIIYPTTLTMLETSDGQLSDVNVPSTVTSLQLKFSQPTQIQCSFEKLLSFEQYMGQSVRNKPICPIPLDLCTSLTTLTLEELTLNYNLQNLTHLRELFLTGCDVKGDVNAIYPSTLKTMKCQAHQLPTNLSSYTSLVDLRIRSSRNNYEFPTSLRTLVLEKCSNDINLSKYTNLHELVLDRFRCEAILPTTLHSLLLVTRSHLTLPNLPDVDLKLLGLAFTPLPHSKPPKNCKILNID